MFNERLKQLRVLLPISQKELAGRLNVSQQTVAKWESGCTTPNPATLIRLAEVFDCSADYLLGITDENTNSREYNNQRLKAELFGDDFDATDDMLEDVRRFAQFIKQRYLTTKVW